MWIIYEFSFVNVFSIQHNTVIFVLVVSYCNSCDQTPSSYHGGLGSIPWMQPMWDLWLM